MKLRMAVTATNAATLDALVAETLEQNPELKFYEAEILAAKGGRKTAGLLANPEVSGSVGNKTVRGGGLSAEGVAWSVSRRATVRVAGATRIAQGHCQSRH